MQSKTQLPVPDIVAQKHSDQLKQIILQAIADSGGKINFARFMAQALYEPGYGYYSGGAAKFGTSGDFVTAPEISPLFAECLAEQIKPVLATIANASILEFGAGSGILAADLLSTLAVSDALPEYYYILEVSADLRERQQKLLAQRLPAYYSKIIWLDQLPNKPISGVVLANEVLDAMPVHKFRYAQEQLQEMYVAEENGELIWSTEQIIDAELIQKITYLQKNYFPDNHYYESEINLYAEAWIKSLASCFAQGLILLLDYGFPRSEYFHPQRSMGTLMCHYQHHVQPNPLILLGLQDITAHVDFTAIAEAAVANQLTVAGYTNQASFLLNCGLLDILGRQAENYTRYNNQIKLLTSPAEMGELFKVLALTRNWDEPLIGFKNFDKRQTL